MKKSFYIIIISIIGLMLLSSCNKKLMTNSDLNENQIYYNENKYGSHLVRDISIDNYLNYFIVSGCHAINDGFSSSYGVIPENRNVILYKFEPLLSCCLYEEVVITFTYKI